MIYGFTGIGVGAWSFTGLGFRVAGYGIGVQGIGGIRVPGFKVWGGWGLDLGELRVKV